MQAGAKELFEELKRRGFITILSSGNIMPILRYYKELLGIDYIFGSSPKMENDIIQDISIEDFGGNNFKYNVCLDMINKLGAKKENIYGIGDSFVDIDMLSLAGHSFAINPKGGLENKVNYVVNDLAEIIKFI